MMWYSIVFPNPPPGSLVQNNHPGSLGYLKKNRLSLHRKQNLAVRLRCEIHTPWAQNSGFEFMSHEKKCEIILLTIFYQYPIVGILITIVYRMVILLILL
jgi:hypothetical protein